jgi:hypothetical protein
MSPEVAVCRDETRNAAVEVQPQDLLSQVVEVVRRDSQQAPETFLSETCVPHGGE